MKYNKRDILQSAGLRMRKVREQLGYTRREMAQHLGITVNGYRKNESGECFPNTKSLFQLSSEYGISMDWLFFNNGPMYLKEMKRLQDLDKTEPELSQHLADCKAQLEILQEETAEIRQAAPDIKEMVIQMAQNPILNYELLLHFHRFVKENPPLQKEKKKKKQLGKKQ
jgi:transcriptional regulator with XRE-family HTH domain